MKKNAKKNMKEKDMEMLEEEEKKLTRYLKFIADINLFINVSYIYVSYVT